jgi:FMN phosphatase YigB (HAD superfamily)
MKYTWLLFDADGTLFDFDKSQDQAIKKTIVSLGLPFKDSYYKTYFYINKKIWQMLEKKQIN